VVATRHFTQLALRNEASFEGSPEGSAPREGPRPASWFRRSDLTTFRRSDDLPRPAERRVSPCRSHPYKCPLPQTLSFDILTNARGVYPHTSHSGNCSHFATPERPLFQRFLFKCLRTLPSSVSCNPFACHSYENCRVYTNNSHSGTRPSGLCFLCALSVSALESHSASPKSSNLRTFQRSSSPPVDNQRGAGHNSSSALSSSMAPIIEEGE